MMLLPKIFWTKREDVIEGWRKFHELHGFYFLLNTIRVHLVNRMKPKASVSLSLPLQLVQCNAGIHVD
jgi:uncharacterized membrane protein YwaF